MLEAKKIRSNFKNKLPSPEDALTILGLSDYLAKIDENKSFSDQNIESMTDNNGRKIRY